MGVPMGTASADTRFRGSEAVFLLIAAATTWIGNEYGEGAESSAWFGQTAFGVPLQYALFGLLLIGLSPFVLTMPPYSMSARLRRLGLVPPLLAATAVLAFSLSVAIVRGVPELFADWRNLVVTALTALYASKWLAGQGWKRFVLTDLATLYGLLSIPDLISYALGYGSQVLGVRTTVFEGTSLYLGSIAAIVAAWHLLRVGNDLGKMRTALLRVGGVAGSLLVLLSFRRSFWLVWGVGLATLLLLYLRSRNARPARVLLAGLGGVALVFIAVVSLGTDNVAARLGSFVPTSTGTYSATNEDHVNDLIDAWSIIERDPLLGYGIGRRYETQLISAWKTESFEVHSAVLHVWLKFGILGAITYVWFHVAFIRAAARSRITVPITAFVVGQSVATIFGTWPYGRFQMAVFLGLALAAVCVADNDEADVPLSPKRLPERAGWAPR
ncbi:MAG TPA: O-antigen ligase family protein [Acidimicrobiia bacterium]|nr:O-antigen ligase family protein [Acidimicrobiia bacterium]